jgi:tetratricopeptide (TPR) repeat protein
MRSALCAAAAALPWLGALRGGYVSWDDPAMTQGNPLLGLSWTGLLAAAFTSFHMSSYQPLGWLLFKALWELGGGAPGPFHAACVTLHAVNAALLLACLDALLPRARPAALFCAALFWAWHPVQAESVAWLAELSDLLCGSFVLGSLLAHIKGKRAWAWGLAAAAGLCRWKAIAAPLLALALDLGRGARWKDLPRKHAGYAAVFLAVVALNAAAKSSVGYSTSLRLHEAAVGLLLQAKKLAWPAGLAPTDLLDGLDNPWKLPFLASLALVCVIAAALLVSTRARSPLRYAVSSFVVILLPTMLFAGSGPIAVMDHHLYLASLAFVPLLAAALDRWIALAALLVPLAAASHVQAGYWHDSETLWGRVLAVRPLFPTARLNLAAARGDEGRHPEALIAVDEQLALYPGDALAAKLRELLLQRAAPTPAHYARLESDAAAWLFERGRATEASLRLERALRAHPREPEILTNAAIVDGALGRRERARKRLKEALRLAPRSPRAAEALRRLDAAEKK